MLEVIKGKRAAPRRTLLYGTHGIGKSTWAANAPNPIVIATEDGLDDVGVDRTPLCTKTIDVARWLIDLSGEETHPYKTVVIDTLDWLEKLIWSAVAEEANKKSIEDIGYAKGYVFALKRWEQLLHMLDACRARGMNVVLLAHAKVEKFAPPDTDAYDRWVPDLHKLASAVVEEWCDEVLFATYQVSTIKREEGFNSRIRAVGSGDRVVYTSETPTHRAKRRIQLPDQMPLDWGIYQAAWPSQQQPLSNINAVVKNGHSKQKETANV